MRKSFMLLLLSFVMAPFIGFPQLTTAPPGGNKKATVSELIGVTQVMIDYSRPGVKGREGKIWGQLVGFGYNDPGFGTSKAAPWRAGANENTTISFSTAVAIEGQPLAAGKYGFHIAVGENECTLIFSKNSTSWGSFFYDEKEDALRVKVKPVKTDGSVEWLKYEFLNQTDSSATIALMWEKWMIPFSVRADYISTQMEMFRNELRTNKGFTWNAWNQAADFAEKHNVHLQEALSWADYSISGVFVGEKNFVTLSTKAAILGKLNRVAEAEAIMKEAMPLATMNQLHQYARSLLNEGKIKEATEAFQLNYKKHPSEFTTLVGMSRALSASGDYKKALEFAQKGLPLAPDKLNKDSVEKMIAMLRERKDIN